MSSPPIPQVRLIPLDQPGATLYNSYQFVTQIAGLYTQLALLDGEAKGLAVWSDLSYSALEDIGHLYNAWELALKLAQTGKAPQVGLATAQALVRTCLRADVLTKRLSMWTPLSRWLRIVALCERRWQVFLQAMKLPNEQTLAVLSQLTDNGLKRLAQIEELRRLDQAEHDRVQTCFTLLTQDQMT